MKFCEKCGKECAVTSSFCGGCGNGLAAEDVGVIADSPIVMIPCEGEHIKTRNFGIMLLLSYITCLFYPVFFYKGMTKDINEMGKNVNLMRGTNNIKV